MAAFVARLVDAWRRRLPYRIYADGHGEGGILRRVEWWLIEHEQIQALRPKTPASIPPPRDPPP